MPYNSWSATTTATPKHTEKRPAPYTKNFWWSSLRMWECVVVVSMWSGATEKKRYALLTVTTDTHRSHVISSCTAEAAESAPPSRLSILMR